MSGIHPTAVVAPGAELGADVEIGPYSLIGPHVTLGAGTRVMGHAVVDGWTTVGAGCAVYPFASIGLETQDRKFRGGAPRVEVGDRTIVRESATINAATHDGDVTVVGPECLLMAYSHIAHDCRLGRNVIVANCSALGGHVIVEDDAIIGGLCGVHQFVRLGQLSIIGGCSKVTQDVPPFMMADGNDLTLRGINSVGLKRKGIDEPVQRLLKNAYKILCREGLSVSRAVEEIERRLEPAPEVQRLVAFVRASERGITR
jgi:UDP-N-acetylglucosamine acyltransferase